MLRGREFAISGNTYWFSPTKQKKKIKTMTGKEMIKKEIFLYKFKRRVQKRPCTKAGIMSLRKHKQ